MACAVLLGRLNRPVTVHGFRSSFRDWAADTGVTFELAEAALAQSVGNAITAAYLRSSMLERRRPIMDDWTKFVTSAADDNVIALKGRIRAPHRRA